MTAFVAFLAGATLGAYLLLRLFMYGFRKIWRRPNGTNDIAGGGVLALMMQTVLGGYGAQNGLSEPQFLHAFSTYLGPAMLATVIELVRFYNNIKLRGSEE